MRSKNDHPRAVDAADVVLFQCHRWDRSSRARLRHLQVTKPAEFDLWILSDRHGRGRVPDDVPRFDYSAAELAARGYRFVFGGITPGSAHLPLLEFARLHDRYRFYWLVEYDVAFTAPWREILSVLSEYDADLLAAHLRRYADEPGWEWWETMRRCAGAPGSGDWMRAFLPFYRLSREAVEKLSEANRAGRAAHFEAFVPTELQAAGLKILDFGGDGDLTPRALRGRFYTSSSNRDGEISGSLRYRPVHRRPGRESSRLYHPVKPLFFDLAARLRRRIPAWVGRAGRRGPAGGI